MTADVPGRRLLIGVGNRDRGDDAVGPVVCDLVRENRLPSVTVAVFEGSVVDLPTRWRTTDHVTIVDAAEPSGRPGTVTRTDGLAERLRSPAAMSTHTIDVGAAVELARAIDRLPAALEIVGIEGASFAFDAPLTPDVQHSAGRVATRFSRLARGRVVDR